MNVSVSCSQRWRLRRMDRRISRSDPHLAAMLAIFARLTAGEAIASIEQAGFRHTRAWGNLIRMGQAARLLLAYACRAFRRAGTAVARLRPGSEHSWLGLGAGHVRPRADEKYGQQQAADDRLPRQKPVRGGRRGQAVTEGVITGLKLRVFLAVV